jgi:hypothetical protein
VTVYLTWPKETGDFGVAAATREVRAVRAARASSAATKRALAFGRAKFPYLAEVMVMPAHQLGGPSERPRCYLVRFSRGVESVEASS